MNATSLANRNTYNLCCLLREGTANHGSNMVHTGYTAEYTSGNCECVSRYKYDPNLMRPHCAQI